MTNKHAKFAASAALKNKPDALTLPMMATFLCLNWNGKCLAHSLDFDLAAIAPTKEEALQKVRRMVRSYVEYGIRNRWEDDILFSAPQELWDMLTPDTPISIGEDIEIGGHRMRVINVETADGPRLLASAAC